MTKPDTAKMVAINVAQALKTASENWPVLLELWAAEAKEKKARYESYLEAGFTSDHAIYLVRGDK